MSSASESIILLPPSFAFRASADCSASGGSLNSSRPHLAGWSEPLAPLGCRPMGNFRRPLDAGPIGPEPVVALCPWPGVGLRKCQIMEELAERRLSCHRGVKIGPIVRPRPQRQPLRPLKWPPYPGNHLNWPCCLYNWHLLLL